MPTEKLKPFEYIKKEPPKTPKKERTSLLPPPKPKVKPNPPPPIVEQKINPVLEKIGTYSLSSYNLAPIRFNWIYFLDSEIEEPSLFYTRVDVLESRELKSISRSPDYYTEIVKMPNNLSDDEYHDLKTFDEKSLDSLKEDSKTKLVTQMPTFTPSNTLSAISIDTKSSDEYKPPDRPTAAVTERKRLVSFGDVVSKTSTPESASLVELENNKNEKLIAFAIEGIVEPLVTQIALREKTPLFIEPQIKEEPESFIEIEEEEPVEMEEEVFEKIKTPEPVVIIEPSPSPEKEEAVEEDDEPYEIHITELPDLTRKRESINVIKPAKSIIRTTPKIENKPKVPTPPPKRERIDVNSLRPKFTKHVVFNAEEVEAEAALEEVFDYDDWLAKWCIFKEGQLKRFESVFTEFDYMDKGFMNGESLIYALERCFTLNNLKMTYLMRVMGLLETDPFKYGANKNMFCVIAALGQRIQHLDDDWFKNLLPRLDVESVENKVFKVKNLWNFLVEAETKRVKVKDLMIEMKAGNVTNEHIQYAEDKFSGKLSFDILDYLTYIPLFIHIHEKIVLDPFNKKDFI